MDWELIRNTIVEILSRQHYQGDGSHDGERCFLTAYQLAVLVKEELKDLSLPPVGGKCAGEASLAQYIAGQLSADIANKGFSNQFEIRFFSVEGLDAHGFVFDNGREPSSDTFSMFRLLP